MGSLKSPPEECRLSGSVLGLPLIETLGSVHNHTATRHAWHSHRMYEVLFLLEGATAYEFADGKTAELAGGHFLLVPPSQVHRGLHELRMPSTLCGIVFDPRRANATRNTPFARKDLDWMTRQFEGSERIPRPMDHDLKRTAAALDRAIRQFDAQGADHPFPVSALRIVACSALLESARQWNAVFAKSPERAVDTALAYMAEHFRDVLPMPALAEATGCSRSRLFQLFKQATGMTPNDYLQRLRVKEASAMLIQAPVTSITDVAFENGFSSSQYFCNVFRKYTGTTPAAFRQRGKIEELRRRWNAMERKSGP